MKLFKKKDIENMQNVVGHVETPNGKLTVLVTKKLKMSTIERKIKDPKSPWSEKDVIPKTVEVGTGLFSKKKETDVIQLGEVKAEADRKKYRPMMGGAEIGLKGANFVGTAGAIVKFKKAGNLKLLGQWYSFLRILTRFGLPYDEVYGILTNCHVLSRNVSKPIIDYSVTQPGSSYTNYIGKVAWAIPIVENKFNELDVALVELTPLLDVKQENIQVGQIQGYRNPDANEQVHKYGRTTLYTEGHLEFKNATVKINYGDDNGYRWFKGLDIYSNMSDAGDSGSVIVAKSDNKAVGLLFAGSSTSSMAIPIEKVINNVQVTF